MILSLLLLAAIHSPIAAAVIGHRREMKRLAVENDVERIKGGFATWHDPTPPTPLRAVGWSEGLPERQSPSDVEEAYGPVPWTDPQWPITELLRIIDAVRRDEDLVAA